MAWEKPKGCYPTNWDSIKALVLDRAKYRCEICKKIPDNFKINYKPYAYDNYTTRNFRVHHKDLDKSNNDISNLMYVCKECHGELHKELNRRNNGSD